MRIGVDVHRMPINHKSIVIMCCGRQQRGGPFVSSSVSHKNIKIRYRRMFQLWNSCPIFSLFQFCILCVLFCSSRCVQQQRSSDKQQTKKKNDLIHKSILGLQFSGQNYWNEVIQPKKQSNQQPTSSYMEIVNAHKYDFCSCALARSAFVHTRSRCSRSSVLFGQVSTYENMFHVCATNTCLPILSYVSVR